MKQLVPRRLRAALAELIAGVDTSAMPPWKGHLLRGMRVCVFVLRDLRTGRLDLQAMSLVFTTILSLVPLLAVSFWVLQAFGVAGRMEPVLAQFLSPLGREGAELAERIVGAVQSVEANVLGALGVLFLLLSALSLFHKMEQAFNESWQIVPRRRLARRLGGYLSVLLIGPVLVFSVLGMVTSALDNKTVARLLEVPAIGGLVAAVEGTFRYALVFAVLTLAYKLVPNTRVRLTSALTGALVAGVLWEAVGWLFASFTVTSAQYAAVYSGFAILLLFILWLYLSWLILLLGASVAFYFQHPQFLGLERRGLRLSSRLRDKLGLLVMLYIGRSRLRGEAPWEDHRLAERLRVPVNAVWRVLDPLEERGLLARSEQADGAWVLTRAPEEIGLEEVLVAVRSAEERLHLNSERVATDPAVSRIERRLDGALERALDGETLRHLVEGEASAAEPDAGEPASPGPAAAVESTVR